MQLQPIKLTRSTAGHASNSVQVSLSSSATNPCPSMHRDDEGGCAAEQRNARVAEFRCPGCTRGGGRGALRAVTLPHALCAVFSILLVECLGSPSRAPTLGNLQPGLSGVGGVEGVDDNANTAISGLPIPEEMPPTPSGMEVTVPGHYSNFKEAIDKCDPISPAGTIVVHPGEHRWENFLEIGQTISIRGVSNAVLPVTPRPSSPTSTARILNPNPTPLHAQRHFACACACACLHARVCNHALPIAARCCCLHSPSIFSLSDLVATTCDRFLKYA